MDYESMTAWDLRRLLAYHVDPRDQDYLDLLDETEHDYTTMPTDPEPIDWRIL